MNVGEWVNTPQGFGVVGAITQDNKNAYVCIGTEFYAFSIDLVAPINQAVLDILKPIK